MIWDAHGRMIREEDWGPNTPPNKLTVTEFRYDRWGNTIEERHLDANDQPIGTRSERCATETWRFSDRQELVEEGCQDASGAPAPFLANGAAQIIYTYGRPGEESKERYYDARGRPFVTQIGSAGVNYKRDLLGREIETMYVDGRGNQVLTQLGFARVTSTYDQRGDLVEQAYFLANDAPISPVAKVVSEFDVLRRKVTDRYLGPGVSPACWADVASTSRSTTTTSTAMSGRYATSMRKGARRRASPRLSMPGDSSAAAGWRTTIPRGSSQDTESASMICHLRVRRARRPFLRRCRWWMLRGETPPPCKAWARALAPSHALRRPWGEGACRRAQTSREANARTLPAGSRMMISRVP